MPHLTPAEAAELATTAAGPSGPHWNTRYQHALAQYGYHIIPVPDELAYRQANPNWFMPPLPHPEGYPYPYPSFIVPLDFWNT